VVMGVAGVVAVVIGEDGYELIGNEEGYGIPVRGFVGRTTKAGSEVLVELVGPPPVMVNCGLAFAESPNTVEKKNDTITARKAVRENYRVSFSPHVRGGAEVWGGERVEKERERTHGRRYSGSQVGR
jgi:hypothetical protein